MKVTFQKGDHSSQKAMKFLILPEGSRILDFTDHLNFFIQDELGKFFLGAKRFL